MTVPSTLPAKRPVKRYGTLVGYCPSGIKYSFKDQDECNKAWEAIRENDLLDNVEVYDNVHLFICIND